MKRSRMNSFLVFAALAITFSGMTTAFGQYVITGTTAGGGNIVMGYGLLGRIASGASTGFLTSGGSDYVTLNLGSFATTDDYGATIKFGTPNDTLVNLGTIDGGTDGDNTDQGNAVSFLSNDFLYNGDLGTDTITNETVINHGNMFGQEGDDAEIVGTGLSFLASEEINGVSVTNTGIIEGVQTGDAYDAFVAGSALNFASEESDITNVTVFNSGNLIGGNENDDAFAMGNGIDFLAGNGISNVSITNALGGNILGGNENFTFDEEDEVAAGNAIVLLDENFDGLLINNVSISNAGNITGGNENFGSEDEFDSGYFLGNGIGIGSLGDVNNIAISNASTGVIQGGNDNDEGWFVGTGIGIGAVGEDEDSGEAVNTVNIANSGLIQGGHGNDGDEQGLEVGTGIAIAGGESVSNVTINNYKGGTILGGDDNDDANASAGSGIDISAFSNSEPAIVTDLPPEETAGISNVTINNWGFIGGGAGNEDAELVACGIGLDAETITNVTINNYRGATIAGGNGNYDYSDWTGSGIVLTAETIDGVKINNWGLIRGGNDISEEDAFEYSYGGDGIDLDAENISNVKIDNGFTGVITGGIGGGDGIYIDPSGGSFLGGGADVVINNAGLIEGGNGDAISGNTDGGNGIVFDTEDVAPTLLVNNFGWIVGGNGVAGGDAGAGISIYGDNTVINNWGVIASGTTSGTAVEFTGISSAIVPPVPTTDAIVISGSGNVVNLNGHSAVLGKISIDGPANSNTVNLNFTGVNVATLAALNAQLHSEGVGSGTDATSVIFTLRGVTYNIDPAVVNFHLSSYQLQGLTPNQSAVGASLDSATVNPPPGTPLFRLFNAIDLSGNVPAALEQLSPQPYQIYGDVALANANFMALEIDHRLDNVRNGSESVDTTGIGGTADTGVADDTLALTSDMSKDGGKKEVVPEQTSNEKQWGFFASGNAIFTNIDAHGGDLQNSGFTTGGLMVGVDGKIHDTWVVGTFFDYENTSVDLDNQGSTANINSYSGGLYAGYHEGGYYANGLFAYTRNDYNSQRNIEIPGFGTTAAGSTNSNQEELNLDGGYDFHLNDCVTWGPIAGLQYVHLNVDSFNETGASAADLAVGSQDLDSLRTRLGARIEYRKQVRKQMEFSTELHAEWQHEFLDNSQGISASFIGDGLVPFSVQTTSPERDAALLGVGADLTVRDKWTLFFDYDVQAGQQSYLEQSIKGGVKLSW